MKNGALKYLADILVEKVLYALMMTLMMTQYAVPYMSVKLSGHRDGTTPRKEEWNIFPIMLGPSPPAPITIFKNISQKLQN